MWVMISEGVRVVFIILSTFLILLCGCVSAPLNSQSRTVSSDRSSNACTAFIENLPPRFTHGFLEVPEDWFSSDNEKKMRIFYYARMAPHDPENSPVMLFNGGPGAESWYLYNSLKNQLDDLKVSVIFMDQRGTGCSTKYPEALPSQPDVQLRHFDSRQIVMDAENLREHLLGKQANWRIYGSSFGSLIVHRYLAMKPQHLTEAYAHAFGVIENKADYRYLNRVYVRERLEQFLSLHPNAERNVTTWLEHHQLTSCSNNQNSCSLGVVPYEIAALLGIEARWPELAETLAIIAKEPSIIPPSIEVHNSITIASGEIAGLYAVSRMDYVDYNYDEHDMFNCKPAQRRIEQMLKPWQLAFIPRCETYSEEAAKLMAQLRRITPHPLKLSDVLTSLTNHPSIKFTVYAGSDDMMAPPTYFEDERRILGERMRFVLLPNSGHEDLGTQQTVFSDVFGNLHNQ